MPIHHFEFPQKNQFPNKPGFPLSTLIILDWYPYVSLFPDLLCKFGSSVSSLRKIRFNAYTPLRISTKKSVPKQTRIPIVHVNNNRIGIPTFLCSLIYCVNSVWVSAVYAKYVSTPIHRFEFPQKNQFPNKPGFPLSTLIILDWSNVVCLLFKKESRKILIMINKVYLQLAISKRASITWRDRKKLRS